MNKVEKYTGNAVELVKEQTKGLKNLYDVIRLPVPFLAEDYEADLVKMFIELNQFANVKNKMNQAQIIETINLLFEEYPRISLQEYAIFFRRIKTGYYGQLYESLDGIKIMAFMKEFYREALKEYHEYKEENHIDIKMMEGHRDMEYYTSIKK